MKTIIEYSLLVVFGFFLSNSANSQGWIKSFEDANHCVGVKSMQNGDILFGDVVPTGVLEYDTAFWQSPLYNIRFSRFDIEGRLIDQKVYDDNTFHSTGYCNFTVSLTGGITSFFNRSLFDSNDYQFILDTNSIFKLDDNLSFQWETGIDSRNTDTTSQAPGPFYERFVNGRNSGHFLLGKHYFLNDREPESIAIRFDDNGEEIFRINVPINYSFLSNYPVSLFQKNNGDFLMADHRIDSLGNFAFLNYYLPNGNLYWEKSFPGRVIHEIIIAETEEIYLFTSNDENSGISTVKLHKLDKTGGDIWERDISQQEFEIVDITKLTALYNSVDSSVVYAMPDDKQLIYKKINLNGDIIWERAFQDSVRTNGSYFGWVYMDKSSDGGYLIGSFTGGLTYLLKTDSEGFTWTNEIAGQVSLNNDSCIFNASQALQDQIIIAEKRGVKRYASSDEFGSFSMQVDTGEYKVYSNYGNDLWGFCTDTIFTDFQTQFLIDTIEDLTVKAHVLCPKLSTTISTPFLRRCFDNTLYVNYCNEGTIPAQDAYVEITIDPRLEVTGSEIPWSAVNGNVYTFDLGDVDLFECGDFKIYTHLPCDSVELGQTLCLEAHIYPDSICTPPDSLWNGSDLRVSGYCDGDSVRFIIKNEGAALPTQQDFIIIEDDMVMRFGNTTPLGVEETYEVAVPAEGSTYRLQMQQVPGHPWSRKPGVTIENCGQNPIGGTNTGFVTMYEPDDAADFLDVECVEVRGSYDPNDKEAFPKGVCASHFIDNDTEIEYKIRFQNVGNDTAFKVVIKDTLSEFLDPANIEVGVASHPFTWSLSGPGILTFTFDNINLVDKQTNEAGSHGFVKYRIAQKPGNAADTQIKNKAAIYFDFNAPIITNTVEHLVGEDYLVQQTGNLSLAGVVTRDDGQPIDSAKVFLSNNCVTYTDTDGKYIFTNLEAGLDYSIWVEKNESHARGITFLDLLQMRLSILGFDTLGSRYRYFASDVNGSQTTTTLDLVAVGKVMNRVAFEFPNNPICWKFFDGTIPFPNNNGQFPGYQITVTNLQEDKLDNNFIGVKLGDVVYEESLPTVQLNQTLSLGQPTNTCGNVIAVPVVVSGDNLNQVNVVAAEVQYDPAMMELYATSYGDEIFPSNTQLEMGAPGQFIIGFTRSEGFVQNGNSLIVGYLYFVPLAQPGEPIHIEFAENIHPVIVQTTDERLSEVSLQALDFTYGGGPSWNVNVNTLDVSPCDNVGVAVCLAIQDTSNQFTYLWNTGETAPCIDLNSSANYNCWVTDASGCANLIAGYENVQAPNPMSLDNYQLVDASGANEADGSITGIVISGGSGPYSFYWNDGSTAASRFNLLPGYYEVTITDDLGCNLIQGFTISYASSLITVNEFGFGAAIQPNPTSKGQSVALKILINKTAKLSIEINDVLGRIVYRAEKGIQPGETNLVLPPQKTKGIYLVSIKESGRVLQTIMWSIQ